MIAKGLQASFEFAVSEAVRRRHEYVTLEHLLFALLHDRLVNDVVPPPALRGRVLAMAAHIATRAPLAVLAAKQATRAAFDLPFEDGRLLEVTLFERCFASDDRVEGVGAFLAKRPAAFRGC